MNVHSSPVCYNYNLDTTWIPIRTADCFVVYSNHGILYSNYGALIHADTWMNLTNPMLNERTQNGSIYTNVKKWEANLYCLELAYMSGETTHTKKDKKMFDQKMSVRKLPVRRKGKVVVRKGPGDCLWCWQSSFSCPRWWMCGCSLYCIHVFVKLYIWIYVLFCMCTHTLLLFKNKGRRIKLSSLNGSFHWWIAVAGTWPTEITEWPGKEDMGNTSGLSIWEPRTTRVQDFWRECLE